MFLSEKQRGEKEGKRGGNKIVLQRLMNLMNLIHGKNSNGALILTININDDF
jgi:hypothetical protein